jgi:type III restriction enzyme
LFRFWFDDEHRADDGSLFRFYFAQREAVETFVYLVEMEQIKWFGDLLQFAAQQVMLNPKDQRRPRFAIKMATGSGKTLAAALCIAWSYFHAMLEPDSPMTTAFLMVAPNVIVFERLRLDFADCLTFRRDPIIPPEWEADWDMTVVLQDEVVPVTTKGVLYLTNVHRLYEPLAEKEPAVNPIDAMIGPRVNRDALVAGAEELMDRLRLHPRLLVINDEAHHVWSPKLRWSEALDTLHRDLQARHSTADPRAGLVVQLDFSATPKDQGGNLFPHIIVDYPLAAAVSDGIVKMPLIGELHGATVQPGESALQKYQQWLDVAVARWRKFDEVLVKAGKRPILFVMCENTQAADEVGDYLRRIPDFAGDQLLVIHTNREGEVKKEELEVARQAARECDSPTSKIKAIVSVLMLREGWDVKNVCVIATLRSLSAKARILPEQALGRGLRRMTPPGSGFDERVVVIEHDAFRDLWSSELDGGLIVERRDADKVDSGAVAIFVDEGKLTYDIEVPVLTRAVARSESPLQALTQEDIPDPGERLVIPNVAPDEYIHYRGVHLLTKKEIERHEFRVPYPEDPMGVVAWYVKQVARAGGMSGLAGQFSALAPLVRGYLEKRLFESEVQLEDKVILRRLAENDAQRVVFEAFRVALRALTIEERAVSLAQTPFRVSETPAFPWSKHTVAAQRTIFNLVPLDSTLEGRFAVFLDRATDVAAFAKLTMNSRFALEYLSSTGSLRFYYPDFVLRLTDGAHLVLETKGLEDVEVSLKDRRARKWCQDASALTGVRWAYLKVPEGLFGTYTGETMEGLRRFLEVGGVRQGKLV